MPKKNNREIGSCYEEQAAACFVHHGYEIVEKNYRCRSGEIDLIARDGSYLVFIEVKYRSHTSAGDPAEAVDKKKQKKIVNTARYYLLTHGYSEETPCRFDVAAVTDSGVRIIKDAFWAD